MFEFLLLEPTVKYCEQPTDGIIKRPYYAISNLVFFLVGFIILRERTKLAKLFGYTTLAIGLFSTLYDTFYLYGLQLLDLTGMFIFINLLLFLNLTKFLKASKILILQLVIGLLSLMAIIYFKSYSGNIIFGLYVIALIITELILYSKNIHINLKNWLIAFGLFVLGFIFWFLDTKKVVCFNFGLLNGRAIFHYLNSISIYYLYKFYKLQKA